MTNLSTLKYAVIDDDLRSRTVLDVLLQKQVGSTHIGLLSHSGELIEQLEQLSFIPDVFFLDIMIEPLDGYEMLTLLRDHPVYKDAIMIALTAQVMTDDVEKMRATGFDALVGKPIIRNVFSQILERIVNGENIWYVA